MAILLALAVSLPAAARVDEKPAGESWDKPTEFEVKAASLHHFAHFVEFPGSAFPGKDAPVIFTVPGKDPFGDVLERTIEKKTIAGRKTAIQRSEKIEDIEDRHFLFSADSGKDRLPEVLAAIEGKKAATVKAELSISARLLQVAEAVRDRLEKKAE
jgi:hypothetical protein